QPDALVRAAPVSNGQGSAHRTRGQQPADGVRRQHRRFPRLRHPLAHAGERAAVTASARDGHRVLRPRGRRRPVRVGPCVSACRVRARARADEIRLGGGRWLDWRPVISVENVSKSYKTSTRPALDRVSVEIDKGEFVFLIGPSGSGKSTFLKLLLKDTTPTAGDVYFNGTQVNKLPGRKVPGLRQTIGCVFQDFRLLQQKTVYENVAFALEVIGRRKDSIDTVVPEVLDMVGLSGKAHRLPHELSGGEAQRVAI